METLKKLRHDSGFSMQEMADTLEISKSLYEKVECGDRLPSRNFLQKLKQAFPNFDVNIFFVENIH